MFAPTTPGKDTHLDEGEVRHDRLDLFDDLRLGTGVERLEPHVENRLFFRLGFLRRRRLVCGARTRAGGRNRCARCRECDFLDVQTRLELIKQFIFLLLLGAGELSTTLRSVTRSAAWSSVRPDMSSTILCSAGSDDGVGAVAVGGGGGDEEEGDASVVAAVASARAARRPIVGVPRAVRGLCKSREWSETELNEGRGEDLYAPLSGGGVESEGQTTLHSFGGLDVKRRHELVCLRWRRVCRSVLAGLESRLVGQRISPRRRPDCCLVLFGSFWAAFAQTKVRYIVTKLWILGCTQLMPTQTVQMTRGLRVQSNRAHGLMSSLMSSILSPGPTTHHPTPSPAHIRARY